MKKLIFIYNVNSGGASSILDNLHKILKPSTYDCKLCKLTHGPFKEKRQWKEFKENSGIELEFLHKDEFQKAYASKFGYKFEYPIILGYGEKELEVIFSKDDFSKVESTEDLIKELKKREKF